MDICVDSRETKLYDILSSLCGADNTKLKITKKCLPLGDIILSTDAGAEQIIIERKTFEDLLASIRDGRYDEQSYRLSKCDIQNHNIVYLIEGSIADFEKKRGAAEKHVILSAMTSLAFYKGYSLYRTESITESAVWILHLASSILKKGLIPSVPGVEVEYESVATRTKKSNITLDNIGTIMLAQIPGVSTAIARSLIERFSSIKQIIEIASSNAPTLGEVSINTKTGKKRKISKTAVKNISLYLK